MAELFGAGEHGPEHPADFGTGGQEFILLFLREVSTGICGLDSMLRFRLLTIRDGQLVDEVSWIPALLPGLGDVGSDGPRRSTYLIG